MSVPWYLMAKGKGGGGYKTVSGPIVSINDALAAPLRSLRVGIDPVQDLHGYDSPWPAGGGKNKFNPDSTDHKWLGSDMEVSYPSATKSVEIPATEGQTWTASMSNARTATNLLIVAFFDANNNPISRNLVAGGAKVVTGTAPANTATMLCSAYTYSEAGNVQLELGSTATAYAPYSNICPISGWSEVNVWVKPTYDPAANPTATIQLGQTVYGGTLDVLSGVLTVDKAMVDLGTLEWTYDSLRQYFRTNSFAGIVTGKPYSAIICDQYATKAGVGQPNADCQIAQNSSGGLSTSMVNIKDTRYTDATVFTAALDGVKAVYELATPLTYTLPPQQLDTLAGQNVMWADTGDVTVEYLAAGGTDPDLMKLAVAFMGRK